MSHNGTIFPPQSVRRLGQKIIKMARYPLLHIISVQKIDQYSIKSCCLQMPIWREEEVREVSSHVTCHATLVSFQPKERSCAEAEEAKKEVHSLLSLGGINAQKVGHLASEIGVGIPKKSNEIFCGSSKRLGSGAGKMLLLRLKPFLLFFALSLFGGSKSSQPQLVAAFSRLFRAQKLLSAFASAYLNCKRGRRSSLFFFLCETWPDCYSFQPTMTSGSKINSSLKTTPTPSQTFPPTFWLSPQHQQQQKSILGINLIRPCRIAEFTLKYFLNFITL